MLAAIAGNETGYAIGYRTGPAVFRRPDSRLFRQEHVERAHAFFDRYGARALILGRFVPIVRTFITVMAGVGRMPHRRYLAYNVTGAVLWAAGVTVLGYYLGKVAFVRNHIEAILVGMVLFSVIPIGIELLRSRRGAKSEPASAGASDATTERRR